MSLDLTGIGNRNEYYTNHYFSTMFEEGASDRIKQWSEEARSQGNKAPWDMLRENAKQYYALHDRYDRGQPHITTAANIISMASQYLASLGYGAPCSVAVDTDDAEIPVFHEVTKANKAPILWVVLAYSQDKDKGIMENDILDHNAVNNNEIRLPDDNIEAMATKLLFHTTEPPRFLIAIGIDTIVLIDRNKWNEKRYLEFDLQEIFSRHETSTLQAMSVLLHKESLCPADGSIFIDTLDEQSHKHASGVSQDLKYALRESVEVLGNEVIYDMKTRLGRDLSNDPVDAEQLTIECLRYMYRMLFVLFIEARPTLGYAPIKERIYASGYSLESLREIAENIRNDTEEVGEGFYLSETLSKLYELIYTGYPKDEKTYNKINNLQSVHNIFVIPPLKAHIFDPEYAPMLAKAKIRNCKMLHIIDLMSFTKASGKKGSRRGRISYANLGINQMGAVYEALLSYRGFIAEEDLYEVKKAGDNFNELDVGYFVTAKALDQYTEDERVRYEFGEKAGELRVHPKGEFIYRLAGREREKSASYYTPESLTQCLVKYALKELLQGKTADEILSITVCEPAMGSAAFLNEAIDQLAEAYIDRKQVELGETINHGTRIDELQKVKMYIADNNVYGIDLNPVAVELAEVSLWLNTIYPGGYVPWFGTQLVNGNSLIGARRQVYHKNQLMSTSKGMRWYENAPERIPFVKLDASGRNIARSRFQVYHFLTGDPGMCDYNDKVIKSLESENLKLMKEWNKKFTAPYTEDEFKSLIELSKLIDALWREQIMERHTLEEETITALDIYGHKDSRRDSGRTIREKDKFLNIAYKSEHARNAGAYARLKFAMDYWCALWFWPISKAEWLPSRSEFLFDMELILRGTIPTDHLQLQTTLSCDGYNEDDVMLQDVDLDELCERLPRLTLVREIANENKFLHWELEFADIFSDRGGFDLIIGNPPWIKMEWHEENVLSDSDPVFAVKKMSAPDVLQHRENVLSLLAARGLYLTEYESLTGMQNYINATQNYQLLKGQQANLYKCFLPQAWNYGCEKGVSAFLHPDGTFDDPHGAEMRKVLYPKLRKHFQFMNTLKIFHDIDNHVVFSINVYCNQETDNFDMIANLYAASAIDKCYCNEYDNKLEGLKNDDGEWSTKGHPDRILRIGKTELMLFSKLFDGNDQYESAKITPIHTQSMLSILMKFASQSELLKDLNGHISLNEMWHETNAQKDGTIKKNVHFAYSSQDMIYSGPHLYLANPLFKTTRREYTSNSDYDNIDLQYIDEHYYPRCNYSPKCDGHEYNNRVATMPWGDKYTQTYRCVFRKMLNLTQERTLMGAIIPIGSAHIHGAVGIAFDDLKTAVLFAGACASLPYDFFIKIMGKTNLTLDNVGMLPTLRGSKFSQAIINRLLMLNCLTADFSDLWNNTYIFISGDSWSTQDSRLSECCFTANDDTWDFNRVLKSDYARRQALIEIDVLVAMALGLSLPQLKTIYRVQFPVLAKYEDDTWYDKNGRIVFSAKNYGNLIYKRSEWETNVKGAEAGKVFTREIDDDTMPGGLVKRTIEYVAPFDKCDRENDYETAWRFFEEKYKEK